MNQWIHSPTIHQLFHPRFQAGASIFAVGSDLRPELVGGWAISHPFWWARHEETSHKDKWKISLNIVLKKKNKNQVGQVA